MRSSDLMLVIKNHGISFAVERIAWIQQITQQRFGHPEPWVIGDIVADVANRIAATALTVQFIPSSTVHCHAVK
jgi:hypothetical protein